MKGGDTLLPDMIPTSKGTHVIQLRGVEGEGGGGGGALGPSILSGKSHKGFFRQMLEKSKELMGFAKRIMANPDNNGPTPPPEINKHSPSRPQQAPPGRAPLGECWTHHHSAPSNGPGGGESSIKARTAWHSCW